MTVCLPLPFFFLRLCRVTDVLICSSHPLPFPLVLSGPNLKMPFFFRFSELFIRTRKPFLLKDHHAKGLRKCPPSVTTALCPQGIKTLKRKITPALLYWVLGSTHRDPLWGPWHSFSPPPGVMAADGWLCSPPEELPSAEGSLFAPGCTCSLGAALVP